MSSCLTIVDAPAAKTMAAFGLGRYEDFLQWRGDAAVSSGRSSRTWRIDLSANDGGGSFFLKQYRYRDRAMAARIHRDKARREADNYAAMRRRGIDVPDVVAFGARRRWGLLQDGFIVTRAVDGAEPLTAYWRQISGDPSARRELMFRTARMVRRMHDSGFFHVDLQWRNLLVSQDGPARPRVVVIDSPRGGVRAWTLGRHHGRLRDLAGLYKDARRHLGRTELMRWFKAYLGAARLRDEQRAMARTIIHDRAIKDAPPGE
jgi:hypothetical protein